ncbi:MAG: ABC transporter permease subunit [Planctomycetota bacterium]|jgi:ABC-2 type transport system permease protein
MSEMWTVYRKEMRGYLVGPIPYVFAIIFTAFMAVWFFDLENFFLHRTATLDRFFGVIPWVFIFLVPAITMRLWSEEVRGGTIEGLLTLPVRSWQLVMGKFLSAWTLLLFCLVATLPIAFTVSHLGDLDWGPVWGGYCGTMLLGGALLALGLWISALTGHQIVAFLITMVAGFMLVIIGYMAPRAGDLGPLFESLSVGSRFQSMGRGVIDLRDLIYFVTFTVFFLYMNAQAVENRRYR